MADREVEDEVQVAGVAVPVDDLAIARRGGDVQLERGTGGRRGGHGPQHDAQLEADRRAGQGVRGEPRGEVGLLVGGERVRDDDQHVDVAARGQVPTEQQGAVRVHADDTLAEHGADR